MRIGAQSFSKAQLLVLNFPSCPARLAAMVPAPSSAAGVAALSASQVDVSVDMERLSLEGDAGNPTAQPVESSNASTSLRRGATAGRRRPPSALARLLGTGHRGRPRANEAMQWHDPAVVDLMRHLKAMWRHGVLTLPVRHCLTMLRIAWEPPD